MKEIKIGTVFEYEGDFLIVKKFENHKTPCTIECAMQGWCYDYACFAYERADKTSVYFPKAAEKGNRK